MLAHRLRRWPNIKPTLVQRPVIAGIILLYYEAQYNFYLSVYITAFTFLFILQPLLVCLYNTLYLSANRAGSIFEISLFWRGQCRYSVRDGGHH